MSLLRTDLQEGRWSSPPTSLCFMFLSLSWIFGHSSEKFFVVHDPRGLGSSSRISWLRLLPGRSRDTFFSQVNKEEATPRLQVSMEGVIPQTFVRVRQEAMQDSPFSWISRWSQLKNQERKMGPILGFLSHPESHDSLTDLCILNVGGSLLTFWFLLNSDILTLCRSFWYAIAKN